MPVINPRILVWARETAGMELEEASRRAGIRPAGGVGSEERLAAMERGESEPTRAQLVKLARAYRRPLLVFYLPAPPRQGDRGHDFRTLPAEAPQREQAWLDVLIREVRSRHALIRVALEEDDEVEPVDFVGASSTREGIEALANRLVELLGFDRERFRRQPGPTKAFEYLRGRVEELGVFVILIGDLGSHHTALSVDTFRGYALADELAPLIIVNDRDARGAWSFTLIHELCHLMLGESGVSGGHASLQLERFCNDVASSVLLEERELEAIVTTDQTMASIASQVTSFAEARNLSRSLVAYRLYRGSRISEVQWTSLAGLFRNEWLAHRERERERARLRDAGPSYYAVRRHRLGPALIETVNYLLASGGVSVVKAAKILGVKPSNVFETLAIA